MTMLFEWDKPASGNLTKHLIDSRTLLAFLMAVFEKAQRGTGRADVGFGLLEDVSRGVM